MQGCFPLLYNIFSDEGSENDKNSQLKKSRVLAGVSARPLLTIIVLLLLSCRLPPSGTAAGEVFSSVVDAVQKTQKCFLPLVHLSLHLIFCSSNVHKPLLNIFSLLHEKDILWTCHSIQTLHPKFLCWHAIANIALNQNAISDLSQFFLLANTFRSIIQLIKTSRTYCYEKQKTNHGSHFYVVV